VIGTRRAVGTITRILPPAKITIEDAKKVCLGDDCDTGEARFVVRLEPARAVKVTVNYATLNGTAKEDLDYAKVGNTLEFAPGEREKEIPVSVKAGKRDGDAKTFFVSLSSASANAIITRERAEGIIVTTERLRGSLLVVVLVTSDLKGEELDGELEAIQAANKNRLLGETVWVVGVGGQYTRWAAGQKSPGKLQAFAAEDFDKAFEGAFRAGDRLRERAVNKDFITLLVWQSQKNPDELGADKTINDHPSDYCAWIHSDSYAVSTRLRYWFGGERHVGPPQGKRLSVWVASIGK